VIGTLIGAVGDAGGFGAGRDAWRLDIGVGRLQCTLKPPSTRIS
jgi:hypothetical protein